jgi:hypothetical protein
MALSLYARRSTISQITQQKGLKVMKASNRVEPAPALAVTVTLCYFEFCSNNMGIWDREWFLTREEAEKARQERADSMGTEPGDANAEEEDLCGEYGDVSEVLDEPVTLSAEGLLAFARNFAVDTNDG